MRVERPILVHGDPDAAPYWQMIDYVNQCEADIAELVEALEREHGIATMEEGVSEHEGENMREWCPTCALIAKHKGGQDDRA